MLKIQPPKKITIDKSKAWFRYMAEKTARFMGSSVVFSLALLCIAGWVMSGFYFEFSDTWQLIINTLTTIVTFLIVILIQNTQQRESKSVQLKLDELLRGTKNTRNSFVEIEEQSDEELDYLKEEFKKLREKYVARQTKLSSKTKKQSS